MLRAPAARSARREAIPLSESVLPRHLAKAESVRQARSASYETIGKGYGAYRRPDARIGSAILRALGGAWTVLNVGAGTGSYEPNDRPVVAVEPSNAMIQQRVSGMAAVIRASADSLPLQDDSFDVAMAVLTVHHWTDRRAGLREMARVSRQRTVVLTWDPAHEGFWLVRDYFGDILDLDRNIFPTMDDFREVFGRITIYPVSIPHDCSDGFLGAYWRRPEVYLDANARLAISSFSRVSNVGGRIKALRADLDTGEWLRRNADLMDREELDIGYRLIVTS
jgi:SAM-dependent methyltransferase